MRSNSLPSGSASVTQCALAPLTSCSLVAPRPINRLVSASKSVVITSKCIRFLTVLPSGTRWKLILGPGMAGSASISALSLVAPSATVRPRTAAQKLAATWASRASKATPNMLLDKMRTFLWWRPRAGRPSPEVLARSVHFGALAGQQSAVSGATSEETASPASADDQEDQAAAEHVPATSPLLDEVKQDHPVREAIEDADAERRAGGPGEPGKPLHARSPLMGGMMGA